MSRSSSADCFHVRWREGVKRQISGIVFGGGLRCSQRLPTGLFERKSTADHGGLACKYARRTDRSTKATPPSAHSVRCHSRMLFPRLILGPATFNLFYSFLAGLLCSCACVRVRVVGHARDPDMLRILPRIVEDAAGYGPGQAQPFESRWWRAKSENASFRDYEDAGSVNRLIRSVLRR